MIIIKPLNLISITIIIANQINMQINLSEMSVDDVIDILSSIDGLNENYIEIYSQTIKEKNIIGKVLACCDLNELKDELHMTFGDWQLFKNWIKQQRYLQVIKNNKEKRQSNSFLGKQQSSNKLPVIKVGSNQRLLTETKPDVPAVFKRLFSSTNADVNEELKEATGSNKGGKFLKEKILEAKLKIPNFNESKKVDFFISNNIESNQTTVSNINCLFENIKHESNEFIPKIKDENDNEYLEVDKNGEPTLTPIDSFNNDSSETNPLLE